MDQIIKQAMYQIVRAKGLDYAPSANEIQDIVNQIIKSKSNKMIVKEIPRQVIEDVFVTALEGGSNYWYWLSDESVADIRKAVPKEEDPYLSTAILKAILDHDVVVGINDAENEEEELGVISKATIYERLHKLSEDERYKWAFDQEMNEEGDAESSDVWMQYMAMGEVVFG